MQMSHYILLLQVSTPFSLPGGQQIRTNPYWKPVSNKASASHFHEKMSNLG